MEPLERQGRSPSHRLADVARRVEDAVAPASQTSPVPAPPAQQPPTRDSRTRAASQQPIQVKRIDLSDLELTPEFQSALHLLENTGQHVYLTGKAGTGKSTLLRYFVETTKKHLAVVAPTGIAAINVGGQTIHSFLRLPPRFLEQSDVHTAGKNREVVEKLDALVIDEVSMVRADLMDAMDWSLRLNRGNLHVPFGGVQMFFFGDLYQLSPVVDEAMRGLFEQRYDSPFFFSAKVFQDISLAYWELTRIFRQSDGEFVSLLNRLRDGDCTANDLEGLNQRMIDQATLTNGESVTLTTTNRGAEEINQQRLSRLEKPEYEYQAVITGTFDESAYPTQETLVLRRGAQVLLLRNDARKRWVNGTIGHVTALSPSSITVSMDGKDYTLARERWEKIQYALDPETEKIEREVIGTFEQYPIKLAWAMTIHKSQGQTLTDVVIDMEHGAFAHGQLYVALSRCTSLSGIKLRKPIQRSDIIFDPRVLAFRAKFRELARSTP